MIPGLQIVDVEEQGFSDGEEEGPLLHSVRSKCVIQLLLLGALESLQVIAIILPTFRCSPHPGLNHANHSKSFLNTLLIL